MGDGHRSSRSPLEKVSATLLLAPLDPGRGLIGGGAAPGTVHPPWWERRAGGGACGRRQCPCGAAPVAGSLRAVSAVRQLGLGEACCRRHHVVPRGVQVRRLDRAAQREHGPCFKGKGRGPRGPRRRRRGVASAVLSLLWRSAAAGLGPGGV